MKMGFILQFEIYLVLRQVRPAKSNFMNLEDPSKQEDPEKEKEQTYEYWSKVIECNDYMMQIVR